MSEVWERVIRYPVPTGGRSFAENKVVIELDKEEAEALSRLLARYVISLGEESPMLTDLAVKM